MRFHLVLASGIVGLAFTSQVFAQDTYCIDYPADPVCTGVNPSTYCEDYPADPVCLSGDTSADGAADGG